MSSDQKKIFQKERIRSPTSKSHVLFLGVLIFALDAAVVVLSCFFAFKFGNSSFLLIFESIPTKIIAVLVLFLFIGCILLSLSLLNISCDPAYILVRDSSTFLCESEMLSVTIKLPCSVQQTENSILFDDGTFKLSIGYDAKRDADLIEFLDDLLK